MHDVAYTCIASVLLQEGMECVSHPRVSIATLEVNKVASDEDAMKEYIATQGPLCVSIHTAESFKAYSGGISEEKKR